MKHITDLRPCPLLSCPQSVPLPAPMCLLLALLTLLLPQKLNSFYTWPQRRVTASPTLNKLSLSQVLSWQGKMKQFFSHPRTRHLTSMVHLLSITYPQLQYRALSSALTSLVIPYLADITFSTHTAQESLIQHCYKKANVWSENLVLQSLDFLCKMKGCQHLVQENILWKALHMFYFHPSSFVSSLSGLMLT